MTDVQPMAALYKALSEAQGEFPPIGKEKTANAGTFSYKYADLADVFAAVRPTLAKYGLAVSQPPTTGAAGGAVLRTLLVHKDGGCIDSEFPIGSYTKPQDLGSALTYLRRYAVTAILGIAAEEDTDAQGIAAAPKAKPKLAKDIGPPTAPEREQLTALILAHAPTPELAHAALDVAGAPGTHKMSVNDRKHDINARVCRAAIDHLKGMAA